MFSSKNLINILCLAVAMGMSANALAADKEKKSKIPDGGVTTEKLADGAVTIDKLSPDVVARIDEVDILKQRVAALEQLVNQQHQALQVMLGCIHPNSNSLELVFDGCNVHIRNGSGMSDSANTLGNLVIGYNEGSGSNARIGSHNLVIGADHEYNGTSGIVAGTDSAGLEVQQGQALVRADDVVIKSEDDISVESRLGDITLESQQGKLIARAGQSTELKTGASSVKLEPVGITAKGVQTTIEASAQLKLEGGALVSVSSASSLDFKGSIVNLDGGIVNINGGGRSVARVGDTVTGTAGPYPFTAIINGPGSTTVLVP